MTLRRVKESVFLGKCVSTDWLSSLYLFGLILAYFSEDRVCMWKQTERIRARRTWTTALHCWGNTLLWCSATAGRNWVFHNNTVYGIHLCKRDPQLQEKFGGAQFIASKGFCIHFHWEFLHGQKHLCNYCVFLQSQPKKTDIAITLSGLSNSQ